MLCAHNEQRQKHQNLKDQKLTDCMEKKDIEPGESEWVAQTLFPTKKDCSLIFCMRFWMQNAVRERDASLIPEIKEFIDSLGDDLVFSILDFTCSYCRVKIETVHRHELAISSHHGLYKFFCMLFGFHSAPGTSLLKMNVIVSPVRWKFARKLAVRRNTFWRHHDPFTNCGLTYWTCLLSTVDAAQSRCHVVLE